MNLDWVKSQTVDSLTKGIPSTDRPLRHDQIGQQGWNVLAQDMPFPVAVIRHDILEGNRAWMRAFLDRSGVALCPHGKTTMSPELFALQQADGVFGMTCATASHLEVYRRAGVERVILANQLVGRSNVMMALRHLRDPGFELFCLVDSRQGLDAIAEAAAALGLVRRVNVLIEIGAVGARTGVRTVAEAVALARAAAECPAVTVAGVETYEGVFPGVEPESREAAITALLEHVMGCAAAISAVVPATDEAFLLTAGGSDFFDMAVDRLKPGLAGRTTRMVLRGGCYLTHDSLHYQRCFERMQLRSPDAAAVPGALQAALEVWSVVQSRPEPGRAYCALGKRDISADWELPRPVHWYRPGLHTAPVAAPSGWRTVMLNDQHLHLATDNVADIAIGDLVAFGVSHPCTTFDKWDVIMLCNPDYDVVDAVRTFF